MTRTLITLALAACVALPATAAEAADFTGRIKNIRIKKKRVGSGFRVSAMNTSGSGGDTSGSAVAVVFDSKGEQHSVQLKQRVAPRYTYLFWVRPHGTTKGWSNILHKGRLNVASPKGESLGEAVTVTLDGAKRQHHTWVSLDGIRYAASLRATPANHPTDKRAGWVKVEWIVRTSAAGSSKETLGVDWGTQVSLQLTSEKQTTEASGTASTFTVDLIGDVDGSDKAPALGGLKVGQFAPVLAVGLDADGQPNTKPQLASPLAELQTGGEDFGTATGTHLALARLPMVKKVSRGLYQYRGKVSSSGGGEATATVIFVSERTDDGGTVDALVLGDVSGKLGKLEGAELVTTIPGTKTVITFKLGGAAKLKKGNFNTLGVANTHTPVQIFSWGAVLE